MTAKLNLVAILAAKRASILEVPIEPLSSRASLVVGSGSGGKRQKDSKGQLLDQNLARCQNPVR
jgi:hypothetical protein